MFECHFKAHRGKFISSIANDLNGAELVKKLTHYENTLKNNDHANHMVMDARLFSFVVVANISNCCREMLLL